MNRRYDPSTEGIAARSVMPDVACSCQRVELRFDERSKRERDGTIHSRTYCGRDRRVNRARGELAWPWPGARDPRGR